MTVTIHIDGRKERVRSGLIAVEELYRIADSGEKRIFLNREDDIDIPLLPSEHLVVHGEEQFVLGESSIEDNPSLRNAIRPEFNGTRDLTFPTAKITGKTLKERDEKFPQGRLFVDISDGADIEIADDIVLVVQDADSYFVIPPPTDGEKKAIDVEECGKYERRPPRGHKYRIRIDGEKYVVGSTEITGTEILTLVEKNPAEWSLNQKLHGGRRIRIESDETVNLAQCGIERFETVRRQAQQGNG